MRRRARAPIPTRSPPGPALQGTGPSASPSCTSNTGGGPRGDVANLYWPHRSQFRTARTKRRRRLRAWSQAEIQAREVLLFSHQHCLDGVGSAVVTLRALGPDKVGVAYCQPDRMLAALRFVSVFPGRGRTLMIADLSFDPRKFDEIVDACRAVREAGWRIEWRDHHHKQWEGLELDRMREHLAVLTVNDDATESGASLQQQALAPDDDFLKRFAETVRDRDIWRNETPDSETLEYAITYMGTDAFTQHFLDAPADGPVVDEVIEAAAQAQRERQVDDTQTLAQSAVCRTTAQGEQACVVYGWLPKNVGLHKLLEDGCTVAANVRPNGKMSIRSRKGAEVCHLIAREFDGGGHPNASGADLGLKGLPYWWYVLRRGRVARSQQVLDAAIRHLEARQRGE